MNEGRIGSVALSLAALVAVVVGCGSDDASGPAASAPPSATTVDVATTAVPTTEDPSTPSSTDGQPAPSTTEGSAGSEVPALAQPAIWPAADVVFTTPEAAAADFVSAVLGVDATLSEFRQGDGRSGEIDVIVVPEPGGTALTRGTLLMRQLGPTDGWYVLGAVSEGVTITSPASLAEVPAGPLTVQGLGRGFEGTIVVRAFPAGRAEPLLAEEIGAGGALEALQPYEVTLDLGSAAPGEVVAVLARGDAGGDDDPGEFSAIPITVSSSE